MFNVEAGTTEAYPVVPTSYRIWLIVVLIRVPVTGVEAAVPAEAYPKAVTCRVESPCTATVGVVAGSDGWGIPIGTAAPSVVNFRCRAVSPT
jgi:hypothetical protein